MLATALDALCRRQKCHAPMAQMQAKVAMLSTSAAIPHPTCSGYVDRSLINFAAADISIRKDGVITR